MTSSTAVCRLSEGSSRRFRAVVAIVASGSVTLTFFVLAALAALLFGRGLGLVFWHVLAQHLSDMTFDEAFPAHVGLNKRRVDVHDLSCRGFFALRQASTVRLKILRNRSSLQR